MSQKKSRFTTLKEMFSTPRDVKASEGNALVYAIKQDWGEAPDTDFGTIVDYYLSDPSMIENCKRTSEDAFGVGHFITGNIEYTMKLPIDGKEMTAQEVIKEWCRKNNCDQMFPLIGVELQFAGNSFFYNSVAGWVHIDLDAVQRTEPRGISIPVQTEYDLQLSQNYSPTVLKAGTFTHFKIYPVRGVFGRGIVEAAITRPAKIGEQVVPSLWEIKMQTRATVYTALDKLVHSNEFIFVPGMSDGDLATLGGKVDEMAAFGERMVIATEGHVDMVYPKRMEGFDDIIKGVYEEWNATISSDPAMKTQGKYFTKANAEVAADLYNAREVFLQRVVKREMEALFSKILEQYGFDSQKAQIRLNFGREPVPELSIADINAMAPKLSNAQYIELMKRYCGIVIPEDNSQPVTPQPVTPSKAVESFVEEEALDKSLKRKKKELIETILKNQGKTQ